MSLEIPSSTHGQAPLSGLKPRPWSLFWGGLSVVFFLFFLIRAWKAGDNDFIAYFNAGSRALRGETPYLLEPTPYRYLPATAFFFSPFALFDFKIARILFFGLNFAAVFLMYREIFKRVGSLALLLLLAFFFRFHNHDFQNAQVNPILLCLFFAWWKLRNERLPVASLAMAVFASFKILPFAFALPLVLLKRWKELGWLALWTILLNLLPVFFYDRGLLVFRDWFDQAKLIGYPAVMLSNIQSLQSAMWWILEGHLDPHPFAVLSHVIQLALLLAVFFLAPREPGESGERRREDWILTGTLAVTVLIAQLAWKHNYLQFLPLFTLWFLEDRSFREARTRWLYGIAFAGMVAIPAAVSTWNRGFSDRMYLMVWTGLAVLLASLVWARKAPQILPIEK